MINMTDFRDEINNFAKTIQDKKQYIHNEETTKTALILPFLRTLGYDVENPAEVKAEYTADIGTKKGEKVDLAVLNEGQVNIIIECKPINKTLEKEQLSQLLRYYSVTEAKLGVLTNGITYQFYGDSKQKGTMDQTPFLEIDLEHLKKSSIDKLENFTKENFNPEAIAESINELKYKHDIKEILLTELANPSDDLTRTITKEVYDGVVTQNVLKQFRGIIKQELQHIIQEKIDKTLQNAMEDNEDTGITEEPIHDKNRKIITTPEEIEAYHIIKSIASEITEPDNITIRDKQSYCGILYQDNNRYPICRLHFNNPDKLTISLFDKNTSTKGQATEDKYVIQAVNDLYKYKEQIQNTIRIYKQLKK